MRSLRYLLPVLLLIATSCSDDTARPQRSDGGRVNAGDTGDIMLATIPYAGGEVEILARNLVWNLSGETAEMELVLANVGTVDVPGPVALVFTRIDPGSVTLTNPDGQSDDGFPLKQFDDEFGEDVVLSANEVSGPVPVTFDVGTARSFALYFRIDAVEPEGGHIAGVVFSDENTDGVRDASEPGVPGIAVVMEAEGVTASTQTDANGAYMFSGLTAGAYTIVPSASTPLTTPSPAVVVLLEDDAGVVQSYDGVDFGVEPESGPGDYTVFFDFNDGGIGLWGGQGVILENVNGTLSLDAFDIGWIWHILSTASPGPYSRGTFEFKAKFGNSRYELDIRGHSLADLSDNNFGPTVEFDHGTINVFDITRVSTGATYQIGDWYNIRLEFDAAAGTKGRYTLYLRNLTAGSAEILVGEYNFHATLGRLADISQFGFVVFPQNGQLDPLYLDDVGAAVE